MAPIYRGGDKPIRNSGIAACAETTPQQFVAYTGTGYALTREEALEVAKRANAYSKLVERLKAAQKTHWNTDAERLLRELGEEA